MKNITKKLTIAVAVSLGLAAVSPMAASVSAASNPERIVIASYYINATQVKAMASHMRAMTGAGAIMTSSALGGILGGVPGASVVLMAASLSANAASKSEVLYAADHNMRVKAVITDYKDYHTSYSQQVEFTAVK